MTYASESAAVQDWIESGRVRCGNCPGFLDRANLVWFHFADNPYDCVGAEPAYDNEDVTTT